MMRAPVAARFRRLRVAALLMLLAPPGAQAHLMPSGQGTLRIVEASGWLALAVPTTALRGWDDDGDDRMSLAELQRHGDALRAQLRARVVLTDGGNPGRIGYEDLLRTETASEAAGNVAMGEVRVNPAAANSATATAANAAAESLVLLRQVTWPRAPRAPHLRVDLFEGATGESAQLALRAMQGERVDVAVFDAGHAERSLFRTPWRVFGDYVAIGAAHILGGTDHLLFLLTVLVAGAGWRWWAGVITTFTVAHSLTLSLAAAGVVRLALVFGCGLLHGLGFAGAIDTMGASGAARLASLAGFNLGVELGQAAFVATALALLYVLTVLARRPGLVRAVQPSLVARTLALGAMAGGLAILLQRLG